MKMSDLSGDSENDYLSEHVDITGSSGSIDSSDFSDLTGAPAGQAGRTMDNLSDISNIPISIGEFTLTKHAREGAQRLRQILQLGPTTYPDRLFIDDLTGVRVQE